MSNEWGMSANRIVSKNLVLELYTIQTFHHFHFCCVTVRRDIIVNRMLKDSNYERNKIDIITVDDGNQTFFLSFVLSHSFNFVSSTLRTIL